MRRTLIAALLAVGCSEPAGPKQQPEIVGAAPRGLLYVLADSGVVLLARPDGEAPRRLRFKLDGEEIRPSSGPAFSPDGALIAFVAPFVSNPNTDTNAFLADTAGTVLSMPSQTACSRSVVSVPWTSSIGWAAQGLKVAFDCVTVAPSGQTLTLYDYTGLRAFAVAVNARQGARAWSPDGKWILDGDNVVTNDSDRRAKVIPLPSGFTGLGWTLDSRIIVGPSSSCGSGIYLVRPDGGAPLTPFLGAPYRHVAFSPDGKKLLAITSTCSPADVPRVVILDRATLAVELTIPGASWATWRP